MVSLTFQQYIDNPMGKRNAVFSQRDLYKRMYTEKFDQILLREAGKINFTLYVDEKHDRYIAHVKVPSETVKNFYYDAVILFYTDNAPVHSSSNLNDYDVKFFSNDPAFVFTYMHVFLKNNLLFEALKPRCPKLALKNEAKERNPYGIPGYSKILYFAFLYMKAKNLFTKAVFKSSASKYDEKKLLASVENADDKIAKRQELGAKVAKEANKEKERERREKNKEVGQQIVSKSKNMKYTNTVKSTNTVATTKRTSFVKRTKQTPKG